MTIRKQISIRSLMVITLIVAVDIAIFRSVWEGPYSLTALVCVPMVNLLVLVLPRSRRGHPSRLFWVGFEATGWAGVVVLLAFSLIDRDGFVSPLSTIFLVLDLLGPGPLTEQIAVTLLFYTAPQVLLAACVGWLVARYRLVIERR